jgi:hypothetical protein
MFKNTRKVICIDGFQDVEIYTNRKFGKTQIIKLRNGSFKIFASLFKHMETLKAINRHILFWNLLFGIFIYILTLSAFLKPFLVMAHYRVVQYQTTH